MASSVESPSSRVHVDAATRGAAERGDAAVEALELKVLHDGPIVINVRLAADRCCSTDMKASEQ